MDASTLKNPALLEIRGEDGTVYRGADQEWYASLWRRKAGCGPTAAAVQTAYLAAARPGWEALCPLDRLERVPFAAYMDQVWEHVTPGLQGLNSVALYTAGVRRYGASRGFALSPAALEVPEDAARRPGWEACLAFVRAGLEADCPVAFLNLCNGEVQDLDRWHWVLIAALTGNGAGTQALLVDAGREYPIDLRLWYDTTTMGGGFVWLPEGDAP